MNKKISVLDLVNMKEDEMPRKIKYRDGIYDYQENEKKYKKEDSEAEVWLDWKMEVEILEDNTEEIEELNAYKLMESPYMANLLKEQRYDKFMELLKQSEVEIADKLIKLTWVVKEMRKEITNVNKNNIH